MSRHRQHNQEKDATLQDSRIGNDASSPENAPDATAESCVTPDVEECARLAAEVARLQDELAQSGDRLMRLRAEFDNYRRRTLQEMHRVREAATDAVVQALLPALDDLERFLQTGTELADGENLRRGLELVRAKFAGQLELVDVRGFSSLGRHFDPAEHEALSVSQDPAQEDGMIVDEHVRGYRRGDVVIRHAQVIVNKRQ